MPARVSHYGKARSWKVGPTLAGFPPLTQTAGFGREGWRHHPGLLKGLIETQTQMRPARPSGRSPLPNNSKKKFLKRISLNSGPPNKCQKGYVWPLSGKSLPAYWRLGGGAGVLGPLTPSSVFHFLLGKQSLKNNSLLGEKYRNRARKIANPSLSGTVSQATKFVWCRETYAPTSPPPPSVLSDLLLKFKFAFKKKKTNTLYFQSQKWKRYASIYLSLPDIFFWTLISWL